MTAETVPQAVALAKQTHEQVEVLDKLSDVQAVYAQPNGTMSAQLAAGPVRVPDPNSPTGYTPVDTTLSDNGSGLVPGATASPITFSDGSAGPLATLQIGPGEMFTENWPAQLPNPKVNGDTATYPDVQPGVDLTLKALPEGYDQGWIINSRPTGPLTLDIPISLQGLSAEQDADGDITLTDDHGDVVADLGTAQMHGAATDPVTGDPTVQSPAATRLVQEDGGTTLEVTPDPSFFNRPDLTYPVTIDPSAGPSTANIDFFVNSSNPNTSYRTTSNLETGSGDGTAKNRTFIKWNSLNALTSPPTGTSAYMLGASLDVYESAAATSCGTKTPFEVENVSSAISASTDTWNTKPTIGGSIWGYLKTDAGAGSSCAAATVHVTDAHGIPGNTNTMGGFVQNWINGTSSQPWQLAMVAPTETSTTQWKHFNSANAASNHPLLSVSFTYTPYIPSSLSPTGGGSDTDPSGTLSALYSDYDGDAGHLVLNMTDTTTSTPVVVNQSTSTGASGAPISYAAASVMTSGDSYSWTAKACDVNGACSAPSAAATFVWNPVTVPNPVINSFTAAPTSGGVSMSWSITPASGTTVSSVEVKRGLAGSPLTTIATTAGSATSYTDSSANLDEQYQYQIVAHDADGGFANSLVQSSVAGTFSWGTGQMDGGGFENSIAIDPATTSVAISGGDNSGIQRLSGGTWQPSNTGFTLPWEMKVASVNWWPTGDTAYALVGDCTNEGDVLVSTNGGQSWATTSSQPSSGPWPVVGCGYNTPDKIGTVATGLPGGQLRSVGQLIAVDTVHSKIYAASYDNGIYRAGVNASGVVNTAWTPIALAPTGAPKYYFIRSLVFDGSNLYASTYKQTGSSTTASASGDVYSIASPWTGSSPTVTDLSNTSGPQNAEDMTVTGGNLYAESTIDNGTTVTDGIYKYSGTPNSWTCLAGAGLTGCSASLTGLDTTSGSATTLYSLSGAMVSGSPVIYAGVAAPGTSGDTVYELSGSGPTVTPISGTVSTHINGGTVPWWLNSAASGSMFAGSAYGASEIAINPSDATAKTLNISGRAGVWETSNLTTWYPFVGHIADTSNRAIAIDPLTSGVAYFGNTDRTGMMLNTNSSTTPITQLDPPGSDSVGYSVATDVESSATDVYLGSGDHDADQNGLLSCSTDGGSSWTTVSPDSDTSPNPAVTLRPSGLTVVNDGTQKYLLAAFEYDPSVTSPPVGDRSSDAGIYRAEITGPCTLGAWEHEDSTIVSNEGTTGFVKSPFATTVGSATVYIYDRNSGVYVSDDAGDSWSQVTGPGTVAPSTNDESGFVVEDPANPSTIYVADGGTTIKQYTNADSGSPTATTVPFPSGDPLHTGAMFMRSDGQLYIASRPSCPSGSSTCTTDQATIYRTVDANVMNATPANEWAAIDDSYYDGGGNHPFDMVVDDSGQIYMSLQGQGILLRTSN